MLIRKLRSLFIQSPKAADGFIPLDREIYKAYNQFRPEGPQKLFCYVPFSNISFSFEGRVLACAYNQKVEIGRYPDQSIHEMWFESEEGNRLRDHMEHNDLSYGCKHCKYFAENRKFSGLKPLVFDKYANYRRTQYPKVLEFELSSTCNLECVMCNGKVSSSIRKNRDKLPPIKSPYDDAFLKQLDDFIPHLDEAKFYGGEPFLIPIYFKIWERMIELNPKIRIFTITNGSTLNQRIKDILEKGDFDLAVSMDSPRKEVIESIRKNVHFETLIENLGYYTEYCRKRGKNLVISFTLMRINWAEFPGIIEFCNSIDAALYVSYLKTPPQFGIWNLPAEEIGKIRQALAGLEFPAKTYAQKNNKRCYEDLLVYLENAEAANLTRPKEEIIPWQIEMEEADPELADSAINEPIPSTVFRADPAYKPDTDYRHIFDDRVSGFFDAFYMNARSETASLRQEALNDKLLEAFEKLPEIAERNYVYFKMSVSPVEEVIKSIESFSPAELMAVMEEEIRSFEARKD